MEIIIVVLLFILLSSIIGLMLLNKIKSFPYKPISNKLLGRHIESYVKQFKIKEKYTLLAITSNGCSVCHTYLSQLQEDIIKENLDISLAELQFDSKKTNIDKGNSHELYYGNAKLKNAMKIKQFPLYLLINDRGLIREIFITENMALNYLRASHSPNTNLNSITHAVY